MAVYMINYDLKNSDNYDGLSECIESFEKSSHVQKSFWIIQTSSSLDDVYEKLEHQLSSRDKLFVANHVGLSTWTGNQDETDDQIKATMR